MTTEPQAQADLSQPENCRGCWNWVRTTNRHVGACHYNPPPWPDTRGDDWCAQYDPEVPHWWGLVPTLTQRRAAEDLRLDELEAHRFIPILAEELPPNWTWDNQRGLQDLGFQGYACTCGEWEWRTTANLDGTLSKPYPGGAHNVFNWSVARDFWERHYQEFQLRHFGTIYETGKPRA